MRYFVFLIPFMLFSCIGNKNEAIKSVDDYRTIASNADKEASRLDEIRYKVNSELIDMDSIYYYSGEEPDYKVKVDSLQHILDSLDGLINEQINIMNKAQKECDSIHHTWAL